MKTVFFFALLVSSINNIFSQEVVITKEGRKVLLNLDGTWQYISEKIDSIIQKDTLLFLKPLDSKSFVKSETGKYGIWYDKKKWNISNIKNNQSADITMNRIKGDAYFITIAERIPIELVYLKEIALENAKSSDPHARIVHEEYRKVNGKLLLHLQLAATVKGISVVFFGYYYSGSDLTLQMLGYTASRFVSQYDKDIYDLLNGIEITE